MSHLQVPLIYNVFPLLVGPLEQWGVHAERIAALGFNWFFVNPVTEPGFSGSLYSTKSYARLNPAFAGEGSEVASLERLRPVLHRIQSCGLHPMVDLVINHTAIDSPLTQEHPDWFVRDERGHIRHPVAVDPDDPTKRTVWGDLAEVDNLSSPDRDALWAFWASVIDSYLDVGFEGFRCDAAYQVPAELWRFLIERTRSRNPDIVFWAENLGCTVEQTRALRGAGFHWFCNSSKWWNFRDAWCLEQHREFADLPSIAFPETHDTPRLAAETGGDERIQRQRYAFAAGFSTGVMMPIGYEFGFSKSLHVVDTRPEDWERPAFDVSAFIRAVNRFKLQTPLWQGEGDLTRVDTPTPQLLVLERRTAAAPGKSGWMVVNTEPSRVSIPLTVEPFAGSEPWAVVRVSFLDEEDRIHEVRGEVEVRPYEVVWLAAPTAV